MTPLTEFLELTAKTVEEHCDLNTEISFKELRKDDGLYAELGSGFTETTYFDKTQVKVIPVLFLCRGADQKRCMEQLESICNYLQRLSDYPQGESFSWLDAEISKEPNKIGRDEDGMYHYSCIINCKIHY